MQARRGVTTVVALFVVVWLHMALQPCLMAAEPLLPEQQQHDCPHCPQPASHCDEDAGRCGYIDGFDYDGREHQTPELPIGLAARPAVFEWSIQENAPPVPRVSSVLPRAGPRLHLRNCVYLN